MKKLFKQILTLTAGVVVAVAAMTAPALAAWEKTSSGQWIYTLSSGSRATGWQKLGGVWYYLGADGIMRTGWQKVDGIWYYFRSSGAMVTGWQSIDGKWYFFGGGGAMQKGWLKSGGKWYWLGGTGAMVTGWVQLGGKWYLLDDSGAMVTGWTDYLGNTYYLTESGAMATGTITIDGVSHTFDSSGIHTGTAASGSLAEQVLHQVNQLRTKEGLPALQLSDKLCAAALRRATERGELGSLEHTRPDGSQWWTVLMEYGVSNLGGSAENLASGMDTADAAVKAWMESSAHKEAILGSNYRYMGVSTYVKNGVTYWAQLFSGSDTAK